MRKNRIIKRTVAIVLGLVLSLGLVANVDFTSNADASAKTEIAGLTTSIIKNPDSTNGGGWSYVYFGIKHDYFDPNPNPLKYRVLDKNTIDFTSSDNPTMFLDADSYASYGVYGINHDGRWSSSGLKYNLNTSEYSLYENCLDSREQNAIAQSKKDTVGSFEDALDDRILVLSYNEATNSAYGYCTNPADNDSNRIKNGTWWLRSLSGGNYVYYVNNNGRCGVAVEH